MIQIKNLSFSYGEKNLYENVTLTISRGHKVGLVGPNGAGKSTLLKIIKGTEDGYRGYIEVVGSIAEVPQEIKYDADMENSSSALEYADPRKHYGEHEILEMFSGLELSVSLEDDPNKFSGGQKTKLALARALLSKPDILLLDEPTNFMDVAGKKFVMNFLSEYEGTVVVISHDLELMDTAIDKVLVIELQFKRIDEYKGTYSMFVKLKKEKDDLLKRQVIVKQKHIKQLEEGLKKMARFTSDKGVKRRVQQKRRIEKEKLELTEMPRELAKIKINLPVPANVGELPLRALGISKSYGDLEVLRNVDITIRRGEKIALIGPNGVGKSTFIKILMGITTPDTGEVLKHDSLKVGYYSQEFETFDFSKTVLETFCESAKKEIHFARSFLAMYMFGEQKVFQSVGSLSGGEKTRLSIAMITGVDNNLLILDEPTTYLDVVSQRVILEALKKYIGTMILVSHTPEFIKEIKPDRAFLFPEEKLVFWDNEFLDKVSEV